MAARDGLVTGVSASGAKMMSYEGETYHRPRKQKTGAVWRCRKSECSGTIRTDETGKARNGAPHTHTEEVTPGESPVKVLCRKPTSYVYTWSGTQEVDVWKCPECAGYLMTSASGDTIATGPHTHQPSANLVLETTD